MQNAFVVEVGIGRVVNRVPDLALVRLWYLGEEEFDKACLKALFDFTPIASALGLEPLACVQDRGSRNRTPDLAG